jgi:hypothetical protein
MLELAAKVWTQYGPTHVDAALAPLSMEARTYISQSNPESRL